jgi:hypothetical protein
MWGITSLSTREDALLRVVNGAGGDASRCHKNTGLEVGHGRGRGTPQDTSQHKNHARGGAAIEHNGGNKALADLAAWVTQCRAQAQPVRRRYLGDCILCNPKWGHVNAGRSNARAPFRVKRFHFLLRHVQRTRKGRYVCVVHAVEEAEKLRITSAGGGDGGAAGQRNSVHDGRVRGVGAAQFQLRVPQQLALTAPDDDVRNLEQPLRQDGGQVLEHQALQPKQSAKLSQ